MTLQSLTPEIEAQFRALLPDDRFREAEARYLEEPRGRYAGQAGFVAYPKITEEVAALVRKAAE